MYLPLESNLHQFRLLTLHHRIPSLPNTSKKSSLSIPIHCTLSVASLRCPPPFEALSYAWGDLKDTLPIHVDENEIQVTRNLCLALEHIRHEIEDVILWIDAVCINQNDNLEKEDQVQHMTEIFTSAKNTIVWLGLPGNGSDLLFQRCQEIGGQLAKVEIVAGKLIQSFADKRLELYENNFETAADEVRNQILEEETDKQIDPHVRLDLEDIPVAISCTVAFYNFMNRDYWRRVWTQQEFAVSPHIMIQCGNSKVSVPNLVAYAVYLGSMQIKVLRVLYQRMEDFVDKASSDVREKFAQWVDSDWAEENVVPALANYHQNWLYSKIITSMSYPPSMTIFGLRHMYQIREGENGRDKLTLVRLMCIILVEQKKEASNSKDRIYGVLGMAFDKSELGLGPEYDESMSDISVYTKTARAIIEHGNVDLLSLSQYRRVPNNRIGLQTPSWVPDWLDSIDRPIGDSVSNTSFKASGTIRFGNLLDHARVSKDFLKLSGWVVDTVQDTRPSWYRLNNDLVEHRSDDLGYLKNILQFCSDSEDNLNSTGRSIYSPGSGDLENSYFKIPIADRLMNKHGRFLRAGDGCKEKYLNFIKGDPDLDRAFYKESMLKHRFRRPFISEIGYVGLAPSLAETGDVIVIFRGGKFPYCLRKNSDDTYKLIGDAYVHGIMYGEFVESPPKQENFILR